MRRRRTRGHFYATRAHMMRVCLCVIYHFLMFEKCNIFSLFLSLECCSTACNKKSEKEGKSVCLLTPFFSSGCLGKYLESNNVIVTHLDTSFFTLCCSQIHTQLHTRYKLLSNKNAIFTITRNDHDSCRRRHGAFCYSYFAFVFVFVFGGVVFRDERRVLCLWISRDGLKTNSPNQRTSFCLSLFLGRRRRAL